MGKCIIISQFVDDTTLFQKDKRHIFTVLDSINQFSKAAGVKLNVDKCEILALHDRAEHLICT